MELSFESFTEEYQITLKGMLRHTTNLGTDIFGNIMRLDILLDMDKRESEIVDGDVGDEAGAPACDVDQRDW